MGDEWCGDQTISTTTVVTTLSNSRSYGQDVVDNLNSLGKSTMGTENVSVESRGIDSNMDIEEMEGSDSPEPYCRVKVDAILKLKDSTRKLLCLLEEIQIKTHTNEIAPDMLHVCNIIKPIPVSKEDPSTIKEGDIAMKLLENQTKNLSTISFQDEDDCSIFKRLTRRCNCLNQKEYNDFVIHFNEDTKYFTSTLGEIIKNIRILKKFLYMGGGYTKNALLFLNEGLDNSRQSEKVEIAHACSHADICNVFDDNSVVTMCISWPMMYPQFGDSETQYLAASFLYKLSQLEEGRRYLNFSSKITNDIKKILRKKTAKLDGDTLESLNSTLNQLHPPFAQDVNVTYYCKADEGMGNRLINVLSSYRQEMTLDEVFTHLDFLHKMSTEHYKKVELVRHLQKLVTLFKIMLMEYDNTELNAKIANIMNNIISSTSEVQKEIEDCAIQKSTVLITMATEPIIMRTKFSQVPSTNNVKNMKKSKLIISMPAIIKRVPSKKNVRKSNKSKSGLGATSKSRQPSKRKVSERETPREINKSKKFFPI